MPEREVDYSPLFSVKVFRMRRVLHTHSSIRHQEQGRIYLKQNIIYFSFAML